MAATAQLAIAAGLGEIDIELTDRVTYLLGAVQRSALCACRSDWVDVAAWCASAGHRGLPAEARALTAYLA